METERKTAIIIGATVSGLLTAKAIAGLFDKLIIIENSPVEALTGNARQLVSKLASYTTIQMMFKSRVRGYIINTGGKLTGVSVQSLACGLEIIHADIVIDTSVIESQTPLLLEGLGYGAVTYFEKSITISSPYTRTVMIQSYNYHKAMALPGGLYVIGEGVTNIAQLSGQEDSIATIQATMLRAYLVSNQSNLKFQKNIAHIVSILIQEYTYKAQQSVQIERHLETRSKFAISSS